MGVWVYGCVGVAEWVHRFCNEKCIGRLSAKLQLLSLQLVAWHRYGYHCLLHDEAIHQRREVCNIKSNAHIGVH